MISQAPRSLSSITPRCMPGMLPVLILCTAGSSASDRMGIINPIVGAAKGVAGFVSRPFVGGRAGKRAVSAAHDSKLPLRWDRTACLLQSGWGVSSAADRVL